MADVSLPSLKNAPSAKEVWGWVARGEVALVIGVVGIVVLLILPVAPFLLDFFLALSITSAKNIARKIKGLAESNVSGARKAEAGGEYRMTSQATLKLSIGGSLALSAGTVTFSCGGATVTASSSGVHLSAPSIRITGSSKESGKLTHE